MGNIFAQREKKNRRISKKHFYTYYELWRSAKSVSADPNGLANTTFALDVYRGRGTSVRRGCVVEIPCVDPGKRIATTATCAWTAKHGGNIDEDNIMMVEGKNEIGDRGVEVQWSYCGGLGRWDDGRHCSLAIIINGGHNGRVQCAWI